MENPSMSLSFDIYFLYYFGFYFFVMEILELNKESGFS